MAGDGFESPRSWRSGMRAGAPFAFALFALGMSFGIVAVQGGFPAAAAMAMSATVFSAPAQFATVEILAGGGGIMAAVGAATLLTSRFVPMGFALGPSLRGGRLRRMLTGQASVDSSWAMAANGDGTFDGEYLIGHAIVQYAGWVSGTIAGVVLPAIDAYALGLDAIFPAFFIFLLAQELGNSTRVLVALGAAVITLVAVPWFSPGVPILLASGIALIGLRLGRAA